MNVKYRNRKFGFETWICLLSNLIIYIGLQIGVDILNVWPYKSGNRRLLWNKGGGM
jgi:hypothetical protein